MIQNVSVLNVNRNDDRWNGNVNRLDNGNRWNAENRLILRYSLFLPGLCSGSFLFHIFFPPNKHLASLY